MTSTMPVDVLGKARSITVLAENSTPDEVAEMLAPWVREDPQAAVRLMVALAAMADKDKYLKEGHAAYTRGDRSDAVVALERQYQRDRKAKNRPYIELQKYRSDKEEGARGA
jgi:hypothetical protein